MTGDWEYKLKQMEHGELSREQFMREITRLTEEIVAQTRDFIEEKKNRVFPDVTAPCPECKSTEIRQTDGVYECKEPDCRFKLNKYIASHELTPDEIVELLDKRQIGPVTDFKNRFGQPFEAELKLEKEKKTWKLNFVFEGDDRREQELKELTDEQIVCQALKSDDSDELINVYENESAFLAPDMAKDVDERGVRISKTILKKEIPSEQGIKLFVEGKTDLMPGFISKKGRPFQAHLTLDRKTGKLGFEFAPRKTKKKKSEENEGADDRGETKVKVVKKSQKKKTTAKKPSKKKG